MEVVEDDDDDDLGELCAEILENWTSTTDLSHSSVHQNPFSLHHHHQLNNAYDDIQRVEDIYDPQVSLHASQPKQSLSCTNVETKTSTSKPNHEDSTEDFELKVKEDKVMKALKTTYAKDSRHEQAENSNDSMGMDQPIIPVLLADTFFDKLLGRGVDGIELAAFMSKAEEAKAFNEAGDNLRIILNEINDAGATTVSTNNGKEIRKLNSGQISSGFKCNFPMVDRMPKGSPISGENRRMPARSTAAPKVIRSCPERGFVAKLRFMLPSNKTIFDINIDNFGEKLWRNPGVDMSDFFNYGLDEQQWKDYCTLMAQVQVGSSGQSKIPADESRQSHKEGAIGEVKLDRGIDERLPFVDSKDGSIYDSDAIIEIVQRDSFYENEIRRGHIKEDGVSTNAEGAKPLSNGGNTQHINCRMINGDKILPYPMDSYSAEDRDKREWEKEQSQKNGDAQLTKPSRERKTDFSENNYGTSTNTHERIGAMSLHGKTLIQNTLAHWKIKQNYQSSYGKKMVKFKGSNEMGKQYSSRKQREYSLSHVGQRYLKRVRFNPWHQTNHHKLDINLAESLCSPRMESVKETMENYVSEGVQKESAKEIIPTNSHNSEIEMEVEGPADINIEEDPEKLKRRSERFKLPLPILKNVVADKSMERQTNKLLLEGIATMDSDIKDQRSTQRRKGTSS